MNEQRYNQQDLAAYLVGSLSAAESERFDELSLTDEEFADALASAENDLVDQYVQGDLSSATLERFKSHYLASPLRREKVAFAETFQTYARSGFYEKAEKVVSEKSEPDQPDAGFFASLNIFNLKNRRFLQWGFAATSVLLVIAGIWILSSRSNRPEQSAMQSLPANREPDAAKQIEELEPKNINSAPEIVAANSAADASNKSEPAPDKKPVIAQTTQTPERKKTAAPKVSIASFILAPSLRGNEITSLSIPKDSSAIRIGLELEADEFSFYSVALARESDGAKLWRSGSLKATGKDENKRLSVQFPAKLLKTGIHTLTVSGAKSDGAPEIISSYTFRVVLR